MCENFTSRANQIFKEWAFFNFWRAGFDKSGVLCTDGHVNGGLAVLFVWWVAWPLASVTLMRWVAIEPRLWSEWRWHGVLKALSFSASISIVRPSTFTSLSLYLFPCYFSFQRIGTRVVQPTAEHHYGSIVAVDFTTRLISGVEVFVSIWDFVTNLTGRSALTSCRNMCCVACVSKNRICT